MASTNTTTYELPNFIGRLFMKGKQYPNTTLRLLGGITGYATIQALEFPVGQQYSLPNHQSDKSRLEGAVAPDFTGITRSATDNIMQVWQERVVVSYSKMAAQQSVAPITIAGETNPVVDELTFQTDAVLEVMSRNLNYTLLNGVYRKPTTNALSRKTRGFLQAITTNVIAAAGASLSLKMLEDFQQAMLDAGAMADGDTVVFLANSTQLRKLNSLFNADKNANDTRIIGGVRLREVLTTFGSVRFVYEPELPQDTLLCVNFGVCRLMAMPIPGKGVMFREELARTASAIEYQIYGELGLDHGLEYFHGKITGLSTTL